MKLNKLLEHANQILDHFQDEDQLGELHEQYMKLKEQVKRIVDMIFPDGEGIEMAKVAHPRLRRSSDDDADSISKKIEDILDKVSKKLKEVQDEANKKWDEINKQISEGRDKRTELIKKYLKDAEKYTKETLQKVLDLLRPYKEELGKWFDKLEEKVNQMDG